MKFKAFIWTGSNDIPGTEVLIQIDENLYVAIHDDGTYEFEIYYDVGFTANRYWTEL